MRALRLTAILLCSAMPLAAQITSRSTAGSAGWLGIGMSCQDCSLARRSAQVSQWQFNGTYPAVMWVDTDGPAHRAGLRNGDTLIAIDRQDLLTTAGSRAFGSVQPGQRIELTYRRDGRVRRARVTVSVQPASETSVAIARLRYAQDSLRAVAERRNAEVRQAQTEMQQAQRELARLQQFVERSRGQNRLDSAMRRVTEAQRRLAELLSTQEGAYTFGRRSPWVIAPTPTPGRRGKDLPGIPAVPSVAPAPTVRVPAVGMSRGIAVYSPADARTITSNEFPSFGRLRYSGRLGTTVVEARAPGAVSAVEEGDSVVVITSGDMSVRVQLRPTTTPRR